MNDTLGETVSLIITTSIAIGKLHFAASAARMRSPAMGAIASCENGSVPGRTRNIKLPAVVA